LSPHISLFPSYATIIFYILPDRRFSQLCRPVLDHKRNHICWRCFAIASLSTDSHACKEGVGEGRDVVDQGCLRQTMHELDVHQRRTVSYNLALLLTLRSVYRQQCVAVSCTMLQCIAVRRSVFLSTPCRDSFPPPPPPPPLLLLKSSALLYARE